MDFLLGGLAACGACLFTNPLEVVKTRMQLQGELKTRGSYQVHYRNVFHAFYTIGKVDGLAGLQKGLAAGLCYQFCMNGVRLGSYAIFEAAGYIHTDGRVSTAKSTAAGAVSGVVGAVMGSPIYLVKTHLQSQSTSSIAVGHQYKHQSDHHKALLSIQLSPKRDPLGPLALRLTTPRGTGGNETKLKFWEHLKTDWIGSSDHSVFPAGSWLEALSAGMVSSVVVVLAMTPFDVISTRLYNQPVDARGQGVLYRGLADCFSKTLRSEGLTGLYKGVGASYFRLGPHTVLSLLFWNELRKVHRHHS
ncbi:S2535 protein, partial [Amia calva]|nr:S2535 protein [Amia calva]